MKEKKGGENGKIRLTDKEEIWDENGVRKRKTVRERGGRKV